MSHAQALGLWTGSFVDELVACGLRDVCLCPGSRSTPLAISFARHPDVKVWTHLDERSCAYFALGMAKARPDQPVAVLCSSGTAAVNFAPAVVEAYHSRVPLIVLTADRPPELQDLGANQTIDQYRLFGPAVKWFSQLPLPEASPEMLRYARTIARRAVATTQAAPMGPVHIDAMFREPLVPGEFEYGEAGRTATPHPNPLPRGERGLQSDDPLAVGERGLQGDGPLAGRERGLQSDDPLAGGERGLRGDDPLAGRERGLQGDDPLAGRERGLQSDDRLAEGERGLQGDGPLAEGERGLRGDDPLAGRERGLRGDVVRSQHAGALRTAAYAAALPFDVHGVERPLIVAGPQANVAPDTLIALAERMGAPVLADALSGLRSLSEASETLLCAYDAFLRPGAIVDSLRPGWVLRLGDPPTSKPLATFLARHRDVPQYAVAQPGRWPDPDLSAAAVIHGDATAVCAAVIAALVEGVPASDGWLEAWREAEARTTRAVDAILGEQADVTEVSAVTDLAATLPDGACVFAGNSMPVRDIDGFFATSGKRVTLLGSRGASGIDGVVSTALGISARADGPVVLVIGDLSFYHDMNGLLAARRHNLDATIVLVNNDGGGIFSFLPQHEQSEDFELLFGTPHHLDFSHVAPLYGVDFRRVATREQYRDALQASVASPGVQVIEVRSDREENLRLHQQIWAAVAEAVMPMAAGGTRTS